MESAARRLLFWVDQGVKIFRVDNPQTKPFPSGMAHPPGSRPHPDVIFLSEAFTRPKTMKALAKLGFSQSYTYFTWRTPEDELEDYLTELTGIPGARVSFVRISSSTRPTSCPVICKAARPGCSRPARHWPPRCRRNYGIYSGFELLEHEPFPARKNISIPKNTRSGAGLAQAGQYRALCQRSQPRARQNAALQQTGNLRFSVDDEQFIGFVKESVDGTNNVVAAIALSRASTNSGCISARSRSASPTSAATSPGSRISITGERLPSNGAASVCGSIPRTIPPAFPCLA